MIYTWLWLNEIHHFDCDVYDYIDMIQWYNAQLNQIY
jgi:hypothetical protein